MTSQSSHSWLGQVIRGLGLSALALAALLAVAAGSAVAATASGTVSRVVDGDTVKVRTGGSLRTVELLGIDAPELRGAAARRCQGPAAKRALSRLLPVGATVRLSTDAKGARAGRYVYRSRRLINTKLLSAGNARAAGASGLSLESRLLSAERSAQQSKRGLWRHCGAGGQPPASGPPPAPPTGPMTGEDARRRAHDDLAGRVYIRLTATTFSSSESRLHLCSDGRYIEDISSFSDLSGSFTSRTEGLWEVLTAEYTAATGAARIRLQNPDGTEGFSSFFAETGGPVFVNNTQVTVNSSDLCP
jgi:endonuclease YncB( thermonuclease family)